MNTIFLIKIIIWLQSLLNMGKMIISLLIIEYPQKNYQFNYFYAKENYLRMRIKNLRNTKPPISHLSFIDIFNLFFSIFYMIFYGFFHCLYTYNTNVVNTFHQPLNDVSSPLGMVSKKSHKHCFLILCRSSNSWYHSSRLHTTYLSS